MTNRLALNLIQGASASASAREDSEFRTRTGLEPPTFAAGPYLGNIGGPVRTLPHDFDDDFVDASGENNFGESRRELDRQSDTTTA